MRAGRKRVEQEDQQIRRELKHLVERSTVGDPMSALRWTNQSTQSIAEEWTRRGHPVSDKTVARCLLDRGYALPLNRKEKEGPQHPNRDAQFRYINQNQQEALSDPRGSGDLGGYELGAVPDYARFSLPWLVYAKFPLTVVLSADLYPT